ncbi:MAG: hypothetical protein HUU20_01165 [Pirellulales bacterium]|nr:hypothetical protein [Pirellulales bacterium]
MTALVPPGYWVWFELAAKLAQAGAIVRLNDWEQRRIQPIARKSAPAFPPHE